MFILVELVSNGISGIVVRLFQFSVCPSSFLNLNILFQLLQFRIYLGSFSNYILFSCYSPVSLTLQSQLLLQLLPYYWSCSQMLCYASCSLPELILESLLCQQFVTRAASIVSWLKIILFLSCFYNRHVKSCLQRAASPLSRSSCSSFVDMWRAVCKDQRLQYKVQLLLLSLLNHLETIKLSLISSKMMRTPRIYISSCIMRWKEAMSSLVSLVGNRHEQRYISIYWLYVSCIIGKPLAFLYKLRLYSRKVGCALFQLQLFYTALNRRKG